MRNKGFRWFIRALLCLCLGLLLGACALVAVAWLKLRAAEPGTALAEAADAALRDGLLPLLTGGLRNGSMSLLGRAAPVALLALGVSLAWQGGMLQLGGAGMYALGAAAAMLCSSRWDLPWYAGVAASALIGFLWGAVPALLKKKLRVQEALGTALTAWIALYALQALSHLLDWEQAAETELMAFPAALTAFALTLLCWMGIRLTVPGLELRLLGESESVARYAGADTGRTAFLTLCLSGLLCGAAGGLDYAVGGVSQLPDLSLALTGPGLHGLTAAALAGGQPVGAACAAVAVKYLALGAETMNVALFSREMGEAVLAMILYFCACLALRRRKGGRKA